MDVYSQQEQRAHGTGFVGIKAESEDAIDNLEVYEALINPRESERGPGGQGGGMMPPPMMGMGAGASTAGGAAGASSGLVASTAAAGTATRVAGVGAVGAVPMATSGPVSASSGLGSGSSFGGLGGGGSMASGPVAAGLPDEGTALQEQPDSEVPPVPEDVAGGGASVEEKAPVTSGQTPQGLTFIDPAQVEQAAREWSSLASEMAEISATAGQLQASAEDFGMVQQPAGPYSEVSSGIRDLAGGAAREFDQIASGLNYGAQAYRDQEAQAAQSVRSAQ